MVSPLCPYKYILGVPGEGIRQYRLFGISVSDTVLTVLGALVLSYLFRWSALVTLVSLFLLGEFLHYIFCVPTAVMKALFPGQFT
jgi:hypothetical protein